MKKLEMVKSGLGIAVSVGVSAIVGGMVKKCTEDEDMGAVKKLCVAVGGIVLSSMVCEQALKFTNAKVDAVVAGVNAVEEEAGKKEE